MMRDMEFVVTWYEWFCPFFMKKVMDIAKCRPTPEQSGKESKIIIQPVCGVNKDTTENQKQNSV
jgi:hypothetical protein